MAAGRRRKAPGSRIAEINYLDHVQIVAAVPMVSPREIGGVAQAIQHQRRAPFSGLW